MNTNQHITGDGNVVGDGNIVNYQGREIAIPGVEAIAAHRAALRAWLAHDAQGRWGGMKGYIQEEGAALPIEASPYQQGRLGPRVNLLQTLHAADRLLVLGEPGAGKTVVLERLAWELCNGDRPTVPVLVKLFDYTGNISIAQRVWAALKSMGRLRLDDLQTLEALLAVGSLKCYCLFDGLNEVPPEFRRKIVEELRFWIQAHPGHPVILTSRAQDELWRRLRGEAAEAVVVQPITAEQTRAYLVTHLAERGSALYARLDDRLRALARTPLLLWLIKEAGAAGESVPGNRGELYARFVSRMLRRDTVRRMDAEIPERLKLGALTTLADALSRAQRLTCSRVEALALVQEEWGEQAETLLQACMRHGLLAGDERLWFAPHQTVQEHFAARALQSRLERERGAGWRGVVGRWFRREPGTVTLAGDAWWAETFVQVAGMTPDADALAQEVARVNPWLALWCVGEGREVSEATRAKVEARSVKLLNSPEVADRRRAVMALAQLRNERVVAPLFRAGGDEDAEVAQTAVAALGDFGEAVKPLALAALQKHELVLWRAALRWLPTQPDETLRAQVPSHVYEAVLGVALVYVPAGPFLMGSDKRQYPQASVDETPQHEVTLPGYWIGKTPVTVARFRAFVRESGYEWEGGGKKQGGDDHPVVYVSWRDTLAYCRWLAKQTGLPVTLPSEAEWEKAARGGSPSPDRSGDGGEVRKYPWGAEPPDAQRCNFNDNVGTTTPVGQYSPQGDSPYGCADMAGNVWEWTRSLWGKDWIELEYKYPYRAADGRENLEADDKWVRMLRGGAFDYVRCYARCAYRLRDYPYLRYGDLGFRVIVSPSARRGRLRVSSRRLLMLRLSQENGTRD